MYMYLNGSAWNNDSMEMTVSEIRNRNLQCVIDVHCGGVRRKLASRLGIEPTSVSRWFKKMGMSDNSARSIEDEFNQPKGWLDTPHPSLWDSSTREDGIDKFDLTYDEKESQLNVPDVSGGFIEIQQHDDVGGSMGRGVLLNDQPGQITALRVTMEWAEKNIPANTGKGNLRVVTGFGDSMRPMFNPGDPLLIDSGVTSCNIDGVYFFRIGDEGFIKRLQRIPGQGIRALSENTKYEAWTITDEMDFEVFGRVLKVWSGKDF